MGPALVIERSGLPDWGLMAFGGGWVVDPVDRSFGNASGASIGRSSNGSDGGPAGGLWGRSVEGVIRGGELWDIEKITDRCCYLFVIGSIHGSVDGTVDASVSGCYLQTVSEAMLRPIGVS